MIVAAKKLVGPKPFHASFMFVNRSQAIKLVFMAYLLMVDTGLTVLFYNFTPEQSSAYNKHNKHGFRMVS